MPVNHPTWGTICCICFIRLTNEACVVDKEGIKWDCCKGTCAKQAGIDEAASTDV